MNTQHSTDASLKSLMEMLDSKDGLIRQKARISLVEMGDLAGAKAQLAEIAARCGTTCDTYQSLSETVATAGG